MKYNKEVDYPLFEYLQTNVRVESAELKWFRERLISWAENNLRDYPWRGTCEPYSILIAEFLLQRTNADKVVPIYKAFLERYPTVEKLAIAAGRLSEDTLNDTEYLNSVDSLLDNLDKN